MSEQGGDKAGLDGGGVRICGQVREREVTEAHSMIMEGGGVEVSLDARTIWETSAS